MATPGANRMNPQSLAANEQYSFGYSLIPQNLVLVAGTAQQVNIPAPEADNANPYTKVSLNATGNIFVNFNGQTATVPGSNISPGVNGVVLNPSTKLITGMTSFSVISNVNCIVSIEWFE